MDGNARGEIGVNVCGLKMRDLPRIRVKGDLVPRSARYTGQHVVTDRYR
jgi:hypothetical protein